MSDFNYQEYLRNNPLLKEEVKDQLITESQEVEEVEIPSASLTKVNAEVKNAQTMAQAILDFIEQVKEKETVDFGANAAMKIVLDKLNTLAKTEEKETEAVAENTEEVTEGNFDELKKYQKMLDDAAKFFREKADEYGVDVKTFGAFNQGINDLVDFVFKANNERSGGKIDENEEITEETTSKMKVSELKAKIKEDIISLLQEEEEEDVEVDVEDEVDVDVEEPALDTPSEDAGLSQDEQEIQDSLKLAYDNAVAIGDQKLVDQIGNSITFFTRTHVVER